MYSSYTTIVMLLGILTTIALINVVYSVPMSLVNYKRRELEHMETPENLLQFEPRLSELEKDSFGPDNPSPRLMRGKRFGGTLSITEPIDLLRERVMLALSRRKQLQNDLQVDANRRMLDRIGKRSELKYDEMIDRDFATRLATMDDDLENDFSSNRLHNISEREESSRTTTNGEDLSRMRRNWQHQLNSEQRKQQAQQVQNRRRRMLIKEIRGSL